MMSFFDNLNKSDWSNLNINDEKAQQNIEYLSEHFEMLLKI